MKKALGIIPALLLGACVTTNPAYDLAGHGIDALQESSLETMCRTPTRASDSRVYDGKFGAWLEREKLCNMMGYHGVIPDDVGFHRIPSPQPAPAPEPDEKPEKSN